MREFPLPQRVRLLIRLLGVFVLRSLREQYAGTFLGILWSLLQPLLLVFIYWWIFGFVWSLRVPALAGDGELSFVVFLLSALLPWLAFNDAVTSASPTVLERADVIRHGNFPAWVFPLSRVLAVHLVFLPLIVVFALFAVPRPWSEALVCLPLVLLGYVLQASFAAGLAMLVSSLAVYIRDLPHVLSMVMTAFFFTAPVLYPLERIPVELQAWVWLNPFTAFAQIYHSLLLAGQWPPTLAVVMALLLTLLATSVGFVVFRKLRPGFADVL